MKVNVFEILDCSNLSKTIKEINSISEENSIFHRKLESTSEGIIEDLEEIQISCNRLLDFVNSTKELDKKAKESMQFEIIKINNQRTQIKLKQKKMIKINKNKQIEDLLSTKIEHLEFELQDLKFHNTKKYLEIYERIKTILSSNERKTKIIQGKDSELIKILKSILPVLQEIRMNEPVKISKLLSKKEEKVSMDRFLLSPSKIDQLIQEQHEKLQKLKQEEENEKNKLLFQKYFIKQ